MKINIEILHAASIHHPKKIEDLQEKVLVPKMLVRRRMSRASKIVSFLAHQCEFSTGSIVYGSAFGEIHDSASILSAIKDKAPVSPSAFQNSVYNTAVSYHSIITANTAEIMTLSSGDRTSYVVLQQSALTLLKEKQVFACCTETLDFEEIDALNSCHNELEYGLGFLLTQTTKEANITLDLRPQKGVPSSLLWMKALYDAQKKHPNPIIEISL